MEEKRATDLAWVIADPHLNEKEGFHLKLFLDFLSFYKKSGAEKLVILGDLFSSWIALEGVLSSYEKKNSRRDLGNQKRR